MNECYVYVLVLDLGIVFVVYTGLRAYLGKVICDVGVIIDGCCMCKLSVELVLMQQVCEMILLVQWLVAGIVYEGIGIDQLVCFIDEAHCVLGVDNGLIFCIVQYGYVIVFLYGIFGV